MLAVVVMVLEYQMKASISTHSHSSTSVPSVDAPFIAAHHLFLPQHYASLQEVRERSKCICDCVQYESCIMPQAGRLAKYLMAREISVNIELLHQKRPRLV
jgi:hypothetical protein